MKNKFELTTSEINTLIAACLLAAISYDCKNGYESEAKRYRELEEKLRTNCYYGDEIATISATAQF